MRRDVLFLRQWYERGFLALWLGLLTPLLCVPECASAHNQGSHWLWQECGTHHRDAVGQPLTSATPLETTPTLVNPAQQAHSHVETNVGVVPTLISLLAPLPFITRLKAPLLLMFEVLAPAPWRPPAL